MSLFVSQIDEEAKWFAISGKRMNPFAHNGMEKNTSERKNKLVIAGTHGPFPRAKWPSDFILFFEITEKEPF